MCEHSGDKSSFGLSDAYIYYSATFLSTVSDKDRHPMLGKVSSDAPYAYVIVLLPTQHSRPSFCSRPRQQSVACLPRRPSKYAFHCPQRPDSLDLPNNGDDDGGDGRRSHKSAPKATCSNYCIAMQQICTDKESALLYVSGRDGRGISA